ncbi:hypothetical protein CC2G_012258 [Coprinopsis cinerea AmutBmut pab1-1]|nr:hypothetical protein CC2G_012258 [Coprinopsis cinerea AmutBmut pab1-1]
MAWTLLSDALLSELGNTSAAYWFRWKASTHFEDLPWTHQVPYIKDMNNLEKMLPLTLLRHPDARVYAKYGLKNKRLQIEGSWRRIRHRPPPNKNKMKRSGFSSFIWKSHLYLAGGREDVNGPYFRDFWCLNLNNPSNGWRQLPEYPLPFAVTNLFLGWSFLLDPHAKRAYLFNGLINVDYFDLTTEKWGRISCSYTPTKADIAAGVNLGWPYPGRQTFDFTAQIVFWNDVAVKILVFGGTHEFTNMGCNIFMELDLLTKKWKRLSGTVVPSKDGDHSCPDPRKYGGSWVDRDQRKFYLLYGNFDRHLFDSEKEHHRSGKAHTCTDYWSRDIEKEKWSRERIRGNFPCPRTEFGVTYNPHLNKVFVFGGYSAAFITSIPEKGRQFNYAYFADTFMLYIDQSDPEVFDVPLVPQNASPPTARSIKRAKWRQAVTPGFPNYRCHGQLLTDLDTGKMYMIGGFTNDDWMSTEQLQFKSTSFNDLWQLKVNLPGGDFEGVNIEEEWKTATAGPWRRCFACGSAGLWKKCGGSCRGTAFFCDNDCLKEGWKMHRAMHDCKKVK